MKEEETVNETASVEKKKEDVDLKNRVHSCLYNWLGYGNLNAPIWFMGMEEGGAEIWRNKTRTLEESLLMRSRFDLQMDFRCVWEELYKIPLESFKGPNVWRFMAAFLLEYNGEEASPEAIHGYIFRQKQLGREKADHFLGELMPLPKKTKGSIEPYQSIWSSVGDYEKEVTEKRFELIRSQLIKNEQVRLLVSYDRKLTEKMLNYFSPEKLQMKEWQFGREEYKLYQLKVKDERTLLLLSTPFFGNGQISYEGIKDAA